MSFGFFFPILFLYFHAVQGSLLSSIHNGAKGNLLQHLFSYLIQMQTPFCFDFIIT